MYKQKLEQIKVYFPNILPSIKKALDTQISQSNSYSNAKNQNIIRENQFIEVQHTEINFYKSSYYQTQQLLIFALYSYEEGDSKIKKTKVTIMYVQKKNGSDDTQTVAIIKGSVMCSKFGYTYNSNNQGTKCSLTLLIGIEYGSIKILLFGQVFSVQDFKLHTVPIQDIVVAEQNQTFSHNNIALVLCYDQTIFLINYSRKIILGQFKDGRIPFEIPLNVEFHKTHRFFLQTYNNGCIKIWQIPKELIQKIQNLQSQPKDKLIKKYYSIIPMYSFHSGAIQGLVCANFFGSFIMLVTKKNILKLIAIDFSLLQSYLLLFEHNIEGQDVINMQIIQNSEYILINQKTHLTKIKFDRCFVTKIKQYKFNNITNILDFRLSDDQIYISLFSDNKFLVDRKKNSFRQFKKQQHKQTIYTSQINF